MEPDPVPDAKRVLAPIELDPDHGFDLWHTHIDRDSAGDEDPALRRAFAAVLFEVHRGLRERLARRDELQTWLWFPVDDAGVDSVHVHTPNANPDSVFPVRFDEVTWGAEPPSFLTGPFDERELERGRARTENGESYDLRPTAH